MLFLLINLYDLKSFLWGDKVLLVGASMSIHYYSMCYRHSDFQFGKNHFDNTVLSGHLTHLFLLHDLS